MIPFRYQATNLALVQDLGEGAAMWCADIEVRERFSEKAGKTFENILFMEAHGTAYIVGMEEEDGLPRHLQPEDQVLKQAAFISFLRLVTKQENEASPLRAIFQGHEYANEGWATAAYIAARSTPLMIGVGYKDTDGKYNRIAVPAEDFGVLFDDPAPEENVIPIAPNAQASRKGGSRKKGAARPGS